jgi:PAS domain-containing protein
VDDLLAEKGDEASSIQALSDENQAKLKGILSLLQRDVLDQVRDADLLREALEFIDQNLPAYIKASLEPISQLDNHFEEPILPTSSGTKESCSQAICERFVYPNAEPEGIADHIASCT